MKFTYLLIDLLAISIPLLFSFHPKLRFDKKWKSFIPAMLIVAVIFLVWDEVFTSIGVWGFNPLYISGLKLFNLPIEEILFFICIPYACVFTWHCLTKFYSFDWKAGVESVFTSSLIIILLVTGIIHFEKLYTSTTFISLALLLLTLKFVFKITWLDRFYSIYAILLLPFFLVNGILTGSGLEEEVVWYNDAHNLDIRLLSIPLEDVFYGMELILANIALYRFIENKK